MDMDNKKENVRIGFYVCHCGHNIASMVDCPEVAKYAEKLPGVVLSRDYKYMCSDPGQELIQQDIKAHGLNRIVVASCSPLLHEHTFRTATEGGGINPFFFHMVNIREHNSWVHTDRKEATEKAKALCNAAVHRVAHHRELETKKVPIHPDVLIVGAGIAGIHAALTLANAVRKCSWSNANRRSAAYGEVRQDLSHSGLRGLHSYPEDVHGGQASEHHS